ncbi:MAG: glycosyltransferase family 39 protein, partial [Acidobacteria bacterium]|nr:glycosyltransferase family 39 protein [Acidobacteriota bacterium]
MSLAAWPERHPGRIIAAIALVFAAAYTASLVYLPKPGGRIVIGDALHHYVQLRSAVFDRDLHFRNEYVRMYGLAGDEPGTGWVYEPTATGHVRNLMPVGPAIVWAPAFLVVTALAWVGQFAGWSYPLDGYGRLFQATAGLSGIAAAAIGVWLSFQTTAQLFGRRAAAWSALVVWLSSSAVYYSVISPTYSHSASLMATSLFWYVFVRTRERSTVSRYALLGALAGVAALMRWQDGIILVAPAIDLIWRLRERLRIADALIRGVVCLGAALLTFAPQMLVWQTLYSQPFAIPQGDGFMHWGTPALRAVLFSYWHGLFTWT